jgi:hypothetical protein
VTLWNKANSVNNPVNAEQRCVNVWWRESSTGANMSSTRREVSLNTMAAENAAPFKRRPGWHRRRRGTLVPTALTMEFGSRCKASGLRQPKGCEGVLVIKRQRRSYLSI